MNLITDGTVDPASPDFAENQEDIQDHVDKQFYQDEDQRMETEAELTWDSYQN